MDALGETQPNPIQTPSFHPLVEALTDSFDDMDDSEKVIAAFSALPLAGCRKITRAFRTADSSAIFYQNWHRRLTMMAAGFGTAAVVLAIIELGYTNWCRRF